METDRKSKKKHMDDDTNKDSYGNGKSNGTGNNEVNDDTDKNSYGNDKAMEQETMKWTLFNVVVNEFGVLTPL
jgi:hypothetical protein